MVTAQEPVVTIVLHHGGTEDTENILSVLTADEAD